MRHSFCFIILFGLLACFQAAVYAGPSHGALLNQPSFTPAGTAVQLDANRYVITPFQSVSMNGENVWTDNRHRAYVDPSGWRANGFLLFDVSSIPNDATIIGMTLRCYLEDAFGSPRYDPYVSVYYSADDGWTRETVAPGTLSLDTLLEADVPFTTFIEYFDFVLDAGAHDWSTDLADNEICIGFTNPASYYSYVYFYGAYGDPAGPPPQLTIETEGGTPVENTSWGRVKSLFR